MQLDESVVAGIFDGIDPLDGEIPSGKDWRVMSDPHTCEESE